MKKKTWLTASLSIIACCAGNAYTGTQPKIGGVGTCVSSKGILLVRSDKKWSVIQSGQALPAKTLLISLFEAKGQSQNKAVSFQLMGDIGVHGSFPVFETAVRLLPPKKTDLDLALERGIVLMTNAKTKGGANVRLRIRKKALNLFLKTPGTKVGVEVYSRHAPGLDNVEKDDPVTFVFFLVFDGEVVLSNNEKRVRLHAPPGPALLKWDSVFQHPEVEHLKELPPGANPSPKEQQLFAAINNCAGRLSKQLNKNLANLLQSDDAVCRKVGVTVLGATGRIAGLLKALENPKNADVRQQAIVVLRHWLGRGPGQTKQMLKALAKDPNYNAAKAKTFVQLLIGFDEDERRQPELYTLLIDLLKHPRLAVREVAHWHLVRLAPKGKEIAYDATGSADFWTRAHQRWRKLIPEGRIPSSPDEPSEKK